MSRTLIYDGLVMQGTQSGSPLPAQRWARVNMATLVLDGDAGDASCQAAAASLAKILPDAHRAPSRDKPTRSRLRFSHR